MAISKGLKSTGLALLVLIVPGVCYLLLQTGTNHYHRLPVYDATRQVIVTADVPDSLWHRADWEVDPANTNAPIPEGKMYVAGFFRPEKSLAAETLAVNLARVARNYQDMERLHFLTFVATDVQVRLDSIPVAGLLDDYMGTGENRTLIYLPDTILYDLLRKQFLLQVEQGTGPVNDTVVLLDSRRHIRGYYDGSSYFDTDTLKDEVAVLWKEEMSSDDEE